MRFVILFVLLMSNSICYGQQILRGVVCDADTKSPIAYAMVSIGEKNIGVVSSENGMFVLQSNKIQSSDSVTVTCMGYRIVKLSVSQFETGLKEIYAEMLPVEIGDVVVMASRLKDLKLGISSVGSMFTPMFIQKELADTDYIGREFGTTIKVKRDCSIRNLNFSIARNKYDSVRFRVLFYKLEDGLPKELIVNQEIIFDVVGGQKGWYELDLSKYNIRFKAADQIAVTLMTLNRNARSEFWIHSSLLAAGGLIRRDVIAGKWSKSGGKFLCIWERSIS